MDSDAATLSPMSKRHVLAAAALMPQLPSHLCKTLMLLATHAEYRTGLSRPGRVVAEERWGIDEKSFWRHCRELKERGLIEQTQQGNSKRGLAAEYRLLFLPALTDETPTTYQGKGLKINVDDTLTGGAATRESHPDLTASENSVLKRFFTEFWPRLTPADRQRLTGCLDRGFDQRIPLNRTVARLVAQGHSGTLIEVLTDGDPGKDSYDKVRNPAAVIFTRVRGVANQLGIDIWDKTPVTEHAADPLEAWRRLSAIAATAGEAEPPLTHPRAVEPPTPGDRTD